MNRKKIVIHIVSIIGIIIIAGFAGFYLDKYVSPKKYSVVVKPPIRTSLVTGWQIYFKGNITEISADQLTLISKDKKETAQIKLTAQTNCTTQVIDSSGKTSYVKINSADLKIGENVLVNALVSTKDYSAISIFKFLAEE